MHRVVIVGAGFGGLSAARALVGRPVEVTIVDQRNFHTFQPLLYEVATAGLDSGDVAYPIRAIFGRADNVTFRFATVTGVDWDRGEILLQGENIATWSPDARARAGIFLAFQYPEAISGVSVVQFLRQAIAARKGLDELSILEVRLDLAEWMDRLGMDPAFAERHLNEGFSGGERKRNEVLQMALLEPAVAFLDETDSGLDIDALRIVARGVRTVRDENPSMGVVIVTHYVKLLEEIEPDHVHILVDGQIVHSGTAKLAQQIELEGYEAWRPVDA